MMNLILNKEERPANTNIDYTMIDMIMSDERSDMRKFVVDSLNKYGDPDKFYTANRVAHVLYDILLFKHFIEDDGTHQSFVDILLASALLYNLFYDGDDWRDVFLTRQVLDPIAEVNKVPANVMDIIYTTIETQLGDDMPVTTSRAKIGTPAELFTYSVFFVTKEFDKLTKEFDDSKEI